MPTVGGFLLVLVTAGGEEAPTYCGRSSGGWVSLFRSGRK